MRASSNSPPYNQLCFSSRPRICARPLSRVALRSDALPLGVRKEGAHRPTTFLRICDADRPKRLRQSRTTPHARPAHELGALAPHGLESALFDVGDAHVPRLVGDTSPSRTRQLSSVSAFPSLVRKAPRSVPASSTPVLVLRNHRGCRSSRKRQTNGTCRPRRTRASWASGGSGSATAPGAHPICAGRPRSARCCRKRARRTRGATAAAARRSPQRARHRSHGLIDNARAASYAAISDGAKVHRQAPSVCAPDGVRPSVSVACQGWSKSCKWQLSKKNVKSTRTTRHAANAHHAHNAHDHTRVHHRSSHHAFSRFTSSSSSGVKSFLMLKRRRISSGLLPLISSATALHVRSSNGLMSK